MTRIPSHTIEDAPQASRPFLENVIQFSPTGRLLNLHAQMAHSPAVLAGYVAIRQANDAHGTLDFPVRAALMLAAARATHSEYAEAITATLAGRVGAAAWEHAVACGWTDEQLAEAFAYLGLTVFTGYFLNYARTALDLPAPAPAPAARG
jgi:hypothetical protein